ncbi:hypothetical protein K1719_023757 [Acacia pycnantha]|nr:hypothetical protein K1719_023757 [Acacia pycnantha]
MDGSNSKRRGRREVKLQRTHRSNIRSFLFSPMHEYRSPMKTSILDSYTYLSNSTLRAERISEHDEFSQFSPVGAIRRESEAGEVVAEVLTRVRKFCKDRQEAGVPTFLCTDM